MSRGKGMIVVKQYRLLFLTVLLLFGLTACSLNKKHTITYVSSLDETETYDVIFTEGETFYHDVSWLQIEPGYYLNAIYTEEGIDVTISTDLIAEEDMTLIVDIIPYEYYETMYEVDPTEHLIGIYPSTYVLYALTSNHRVLAYGYNRYKLLGMTHEEMVSEPEDLTAQFQLEENEFINTIYPGFAGTIFCTSNNRYFILGSTYHIGFNDGYMIPLEITSSLQLDTGEHITHFGDFYGFTFLTSNHRVIELDVYKSEITVQDITSTFPLEDDDYIVDIYARKSTFAVTSNGEVFSYGSNLYGQLGNNDVDFEHDDWSIAQRNFSDAYDIDTPTNITDNFHFHEGESIIDITIFGEYVTFLTSEYRVFGTGSIHYLFTDEDEHTIEYSDIPYDITQAFNLEPGEHIEELKNMLFITSNNRKLGVEMAHIFYDQYDTTSDIIDLTDILPDTVQSIGHSLGLTYVFDGSNHVHVVGSTYTESFLYRDQMELPIGTDTYPCTRTTRSVQDTTCISFENLIDITEFIPIGYNIISTTSYRFEDPYSIDGNYIDMYTELPQTNDEKYPNHNVYLIENEPQ